MRALLIEFDPVTGNRAGGIDPRDRQLLCYGWQNLEVIPCLEIRLVLDEERDLSMYKNTKGVTILQGKQAIHDAVQQYMPVQYSIDSEVLLLEDMKQKNLALDIITGKGRGEIAREAFKRGLFGVTEHKPQLLDKRVIELLGLKDD